MTKRTPEEQATFDKRMAARERQCRIDLGVPLDYEFKGETPEEWKAEIDEFINKKKQSKQ